MMPSEHTIRDPKQATVSLTALAPFIRLLKEKAADVARCAADLGVDVLARWGIAVADVESAASIRIPHEVAVELFEVFMNAVQEPSAAIRANCSSTFAEAAQPWVRLSNACHNYPLLIDAKLTLARRGERAELRYEVAHALSAPPAMNEFAISSNLAMTIIHLEPEGAMLPFEVTFRHSAPIHHGVFQKLYGVPARFDAEHDAIVFLASMLTRALKTADPVLHRMLRGWASRELAQLQARNALPFQVRKFDARSRWNSRVARRSNALPTACI